MTVTANDRGRLTAIQTRLRDLRAREADLQKEAASMAVRADGTVDSNSPAYQALSVVRADIEAARGHEQRLVSQMAGMADSFGGGESILEDPAVVHELEQMAVTSARFGDKGIGTIVGRDELVQGIRSGRFEPGAQALDAPGVVDIGSPDDPSRLGPYLGIRPQVRRRLRILQAIQAQSMSGGSFYYTQESGGLDYAVETSEDAIKPEAGVNLDNEQVIARTIPNWIKVPRPQLADVPQLRGALEQRLVYGVLRRLEGQILAGNGSGENLKGILAHDIGSVTFDGSAPLSDLTLDGITTVLVADAVPDLAVFNPVDLATMLKAKADPSGVRLDSDGAFSTTANTVWDLPRVASNAIPVGTALVGDFALGCTLYIREGVNVRMSDSDQDDFVHGRVTLLGEGRFGLAVWSAGCFCEVHLAEEA